MRSLNEVYHFIVWMWKKQTDVFYFWHLCVFVTIASWTAAWQLHNIDRMISGRFVLTGLLSMALILVWYCIKLCFSTQWFAYQREKERVFDMLNDKHHLR